MKLKLKIINLEGIYLEKEVDNVVVNTVNGQLTILANHLPLIASIEISHLVINNDSLQDVYAIAGGVLYVTEVDCKIITPAIENVKDIDIKRAENAKTRALRRINSQDENIDIKRAEVALKRALNRLSF